MSVAWYRQYSTNPFPRALPCPLWSCPRRAVLLALCATALAILGDSCDGVP